MIARLALRGLAAHRTRLGLTVVAVVLGVAFVSGAMIFSATLTRAYDAMFATAGAGADAVVRPRQALGGDGDAGAPIPASVLAAVSRVDGVAKAHGSVSGFAGVLDRRGDLVTGAQDTPQLGVDWTDDPDFGAMDLVAGRGPRTATEIAIDADTAKKTGYRVGDRVTVALRGPSREFTVSGIFRFGGSGVIGGSSMTAFEPATAGRLLTGRSGVYTRIAAHAERGVSQARLRDAIARVLPAGLEAVTGRRAAEDASGAITAQVGILPTMLRNFSLVAAFVGSYIIINTFAILVARRTRELALLRAVGASRSQVRRLILGEALGVGLAGATIGLAAGAGLAAGLRAIAGAAGAGLPPGGLAVTAPAVLAAYAIGTFVTTLAAYPAARRAARIPPAAALRDDAVPPARSLRRRGLAGIATALAGAGALAGGVAGSGRVAGYLTGAGAALLFAGVTILCPLICRPVAWAVGWPFARFFGVAGRLGRSNARRDPRRTAATATALMIGLALSGMVSVLGSSLNASVDRSLGTGTGADFQISAMKGAGERSFAPQVRDAVGAVPGVRSAVGADEVRLRLGGRVRTALAGDPPAMAEPYGLRVERGSLRLAAGEVLVDHRTAESMDWTAGTVVAGQYGDGARASVRIAGIYADGADLPPVIVGTTDYDAHYAGGRFAEVRIVLDPGADPAATGRALRSTLRAWPGLDVRDRSDVAARAREGVDEFLAFILVLLVLSLIIAALGIVNVLALSVIERTGEIGLLRAVGMGRAQVRRMIRYEAVVVAVFGAVLGLGLGVVLGWAFRRAAAGDGIEVLSVPFARLGLYVLAATLIGVFAAIWPARRAARMDVLRAIAAE